MKYSAISETTLSAFLDKCNQKIKEGYYPLGGVSSTQLNYSIRYVQAFLKEEKDD